MGSALSVLTESIKTAIAALTQQIAELRKMDGHDMTTRRLQQLLVVMKSNKLPQKNQEETALVVLRKKVAYVITAMGQQIDALNQLDADIKNRCLDLGIIKTFLEESIKKI